MCVNLKTFRINNSLIQILITSNSSKTLKTQMKIFILFILACFSQVEGKSYQTCEISQISVTMSIYYSKPKVIFAKMCDNTNICLDFQCFSPKFYIKLCVIIKFSSSCNEIRESAS